MLQQATRVMVEEIPRDRWRDVTVRVMSSAIEMFRGSVSSQKLRYLRDYNHSHYHIISIIIIITSSSSS